MPPHSLIDQIIPHAAIPMPESVKSQKKKLLMRKLTPLRIKGSSGRKGDSPPLNANIGWTITFVYIAANLDTEP